MLLKRIALQNVRSFWDRQELHTDGSISILVGPNGGGKTNLLDAIVVMLRRYMFKSKYAHLSPSPENQNRYEFRDNDALNQLQLETYNNRTDKESLVELEIEITATDIESMELMQHGADELQRLARPKYLGVNLAMCKSWDLRRIKPGDRVTYKLRNHQLAVEETEVATWFLQYLQLFEMDGMIREEFGKSALRMPILYLPVHRSASGFASAVRLADYNDADQKRILDATSSRSGGQLIPLAVGRIARKYRQLLEEVQGGAASRLREEPTLKEMGTLLRSLGYEWELTTVDINSNSYNISLKKQGSSFLVGAASSGEKELLTYVFGIYALNVRNALILIDEPELHLHPKWQSVLLDVFAKLASSTGNQFLMATHSPTFISPSSVQYVSRIYSASQASRIVASDTTGLPNAKHLAHIVTTQNNERMFFADTVVLVEGAVDRILFDAIMRRFSALRSRRSVVEVVAVGGKGLFAPYRRMLDVFQVPNFIIADLDYVEQVGGPSLKALFKVDEAEIKKDVIENSTSVDGATLVASIQRAVETGSWDHVKDLWAYIKLRRQRLRTDLTGQEKQLLAAFIKEKKQERTFILSRGAIEKYLPEGQRSKDLQKLIEFVGSDKFWDELPAGPRTEIETVVDEVFRPA